MSEFRYVRRPDVLKLDFDTKQASPNDFNLYNAFMVYISN